MVRLYEEQAELVMVDAINFSRSLIILSLCLSGKNK